MLQKLDLTDKEIKILTSVLDSLDALYDMNEDFGKIGLDLEFNDSYNESQSCLYDILETYIPPYTGDPISAFDKTDIAYNLISEVAKDYHFGKKDAMEAITRIVTYDWKEGQDDK